MSDTCEETESLRRDPAPRAVSDTPAGRARVRTARTAVAAVFWLNGLAIASWFARVPAARDAVELSAGALGLLLLSLSAGAVLAMPTAGAVAGRLGEARTVAGGALLVATGLVVVGVAGGTGVSAPEVAAWGVGLGLFAVGLGSGTCNVAMNVEAAAVERLLGRTVMPRFHAAWSLGSVTGAAATAAAAQAGMPAQTHLALVAAATAAGTLLAVRSFLPVPPTGPGGPRRAARRESGVLSAWREPRTLLVGLLVLVMAFTEGTANDWLAVAFVDGHGVSEAAGAAVFGLFVAAMTAGRTFGPGLLDRWGRGPVLLVTMLLAIAGAALAVLAGPLPLALVGVAAWGLGTSLGFPIGMSAAADDQAHAAARVGVVSVIGYTAFLAGPPLVGLLGDQVGVLRALLVVPILLLPALALVPTARRPSPAATIL